MHVNDPSDMSLADLKRTAGDPTDRLAYAGEHHRRKNRKAAATRQHWRDTRCQFLMTFVEFRQQGVRNKMLRELGMEPIYLPHEKQPSAIH